MHLSREQEILRQFVTDRRFDRMISVLRERTRYVTVVVEDLYQPHNGSAVLRTCDAFGVQDVHIIENRNPWRVNPGVELGTAQWLTLHRYRNATLDPAGSPITGPVEETMRCIKQLRHAGYRIVATEPRDTGYTPATLPLDDSPVALLFGSEKEGLTPTALAAADDYLAIPMVGFVESLNISVSAAVTLHTITNRLRERMIPWQLSSSAAEEILTGWLKQDIPLWEEIIRRAYEDS
jgi:tRNA (guanosine-2'-O-)-methyltransferase